VKTIREIDSIMNIIPEEWRGRWCGSEAGPCACLGCVQIGNRFIMFEKLMGRKFLGDPEYINEVGIRPDIFQSLKITKEEWLAWRQVP